MTTTVKVKTHDWRVRVDIIEKGEVVSQQLVEAHGEGSISIWQGRSITLVEMPLEPKPVEE